jgi:hypothetical protein
MYSTVSDKKDVELIKTLKVKSNLKLYVEIRLLLLTQATGVMDSTKSDDRGSDPRGL